ncbi:MAG TPA: hypothetical protein VGD67_21850 [Pseudonocardiaceae bacterium]
MRPRTALASLIAVATVALGLVATAAPASAGALDVTCVPPSSQTLTFTPPLTMTPGPVLVSASTQYGPCTSATVPGLTAGSRNATFPYPSLSCLDLLDSSAVTFTITWNTGQQSTISGNTTVSRVGAAVVVTITGNVTAGLFAGDAVVQTVTGAATAITLCTLGLGTVSSLYALVTLAITSAS